MIIIHCRTSIAPEKQAEYIARVNEAQIVEKTRKEPGNLWYELSVSAGEPGTLYVIERWESRKSLPAHMKSENYKNISRLNAEYGVKTDVKLFTAEPMG